MPPLAYVYIRLIRMTLRIEYRNEGVLARARADHGPYMLVVWHSRLMMMPFGYPGNRFVVLVSRHSDAVMYARILGQFGYECAFGSSTAGGLAGMRSLLRRVRNGYDAGWAPDGPRGPRRRAKPGVIVAARLSGMPLIPAAFSARPARRVGSWDRTLVPYPFARGVFLYGEPLIVPRDADPLAEEALRQALEEKLDRVTDEADRLVGTEISEPRPPVEA